MSVSSGWDGKKVKEWSCMLLAPFLCGPSSFNGVKVYHKKPVIVFMFYNVASSIRVSRLKT